MIAHTRSWATSVGPCSMHWGYGADYGFAAYGPDDGDAPREPGMGAGDTCYYESTGP